MTRSEITGLSIEQVQTMVRRELSTPKRVGYLLAMMGTLLAAGLIATLWLTEPGPLPMRTNAAFAGLVMINIAWSALFGWVITRRKVLFAAHSVIASWMAVAFCGIFLLAGAGITLANSNALAFVSVAVVGGIQLLVAVKVLLRARRRRKQLLSRRAELAGLLSETVA